LGVLDIRLQIAIEQARKVGIRPTEFVNFAQYCWIHWAGQMLANRMLEWLATKSRGHPAQQHGAAKLTWLDLSPFPNLISEFMRQISGIWKWELWIPGQG
jgi:hypothetical protein